MGYMSDFGWEQQLLADLPMEIIMIMDIAYSYDVLPNFAQNQVLTDFGASPTQL